MGSNIKIYENIRQNSSFFLTLAVIFEFYMVSWRPGRYLETFLEPVASLWLSMGPWRAVATPFASKMTDILCSWQAKHVLCCPWETRMCSFERAHMPSFEKPAKWGPNKWGPNQWGPNKWALGHKHLDPIYLDPVTSHLSTALSSFLKIGVWEVRKVENKKVLGIGFAWCGNCWGTSWESFAHG